MGARRSGSAWRLSGVRWESRVGVDRAAPDALPGETWRFGWGGQHDAAIMQASHLVRSGRAQAWRDRRRARRDDGYVVSDWDRSTAARVLGVQSRVSAIRARDPRGTGAVVSDGARNSPTANELVDDLTSEPGHLHPVATVGCSSSLGSEGAGKHRYKIITRRFM